METVYLVVAANMLGVTIYEIRQLGNDGKLSISRDDSGIEQVTMDSLRDYEFSRRREQAARRKQETGRGGLI